jgi:hypothetical protein
MKYKSPAKSRLFAFHSLLLGLYPVLALYLVNRSEILISGIWQALVTSCVVTLTAAGFFLVLFRAWNTASLFASFTLLMFFLYGHIFEISGELLVDGEQVARHRYFIPLWLLTYAAGFVFLYRRKGDASLVRIPNLIASFLVAFLAVQAIYDSVPEALDGPTAAADTQRLPAAANPAGRDVYYIVIDTYGRQDVLQEKFGVDIQPFLSSLQEIGFYVPACSQSNYPYTRSSMTAALNM